MVPQVFDYYSVFFPFTKWDRSHACSLNATGGRSDKYWVVTSQNQVLLSYLLAECLARKFFLLDGRNFNKVPLGKFRNRWENRCNKCSIQYVSPPTCATCSSVLDLICAQQQICLASRIYNVRFKEAKSDFFFSLLNMKVAAGESEFNLKLSDIVFLELELGYGAREHAFSSYSTTKRRIWNSNRNISISQSGSSNCNRSCPSLINALHALPLSTRSQTKAMI